MFTPLMDSKYQMVFGKLHRRVFSKWMDQYSIELERIQREERIAKIELNRSFSELRTIPEDQKQIEVSPVTGSEKVLSRDLIGWNSITPSPFSIFEEMRNSKDSIVRVQNKTSVSSLK